MKTQETLQSKRDSAGFTRSLSSWSTNSERRAGWATILTVLLLAGQAAGKTVNVDVGSGNVFSPSGVSIQTGDTVKWTWKGSNHSVTATNIEIADFDSGVRNTGSTFSVTFPYPNPASFPPGFRYHCSVHGETGVVFVHSPCPSATPLPASQAQLLNISARMDVKTGDNLLIGGFIVTGNVAKKVILRAIGPSLSPGVVGALADPVLELHASDGSLITSNDNWRSDQEAEIIASTIPPTDDLESAIVATLDPGAYTAIVSGKGGTSGVALVECYDLDQPADAQLANISARGLVETDNNVMIGGFILGNGSGTTNVVIRALGPSLPVAGTMADPTLELHDANGDIVMSNDNWKDTQQCELEATGIPPEDDLESAMVVTIPTGAYTAIVADKNNGTGVALVEVYRLP
jgi:plastocyanin